MRGTLQQSEEQRLGIVVAVQANFYRVRLLPTGIERQLTQDMVGAMPRLWLGDASRQELLCTRRALLKKTGQSVMVGDFVWLAEPDEAGGRGAIAQVLARKTSLRRPPIANADQVLLVFSLAQPSIDPFQLTKFLLTAEQTGMSIVIGLSKADLTDASEQWCDRLSQWGYPAFVFSIKTGQGLASLRTQLKQRLTILAGPSGVGKSSLINHLNPGLDLRTGAVSARWHQGRHTTRHVELFEISPDTLLADSPGFNQPNLEMPPESLAQLFPEIRRQLDGASCQFNNCLHQGEPNCAIAPDWERSHYYQMLLEDLLHKQMLAQQQSLDSSQRKRRISSGGQVRYEPRLEQKKYRRQSRRRQHQVLDDFYSEELLDDDASDISEQTTGSPH